MGTKIWSWGYNYVGSLGDGTNTTRSSPVQVIGNLDNWSKISTTYSFSSHIAGIKKDGTLWLWGANGDGQLGIETTIHSNSPVQTITYGTNWSQASCGNGFTGAIKTDGTLWMWGFNNSGQLGDNTEGYANRKSSPVQVITFSTDWSFVDCGAGHAAAIKKDGTLWLWGNNSGGELGDYTTDSKSSPVQVYGGGATWSKVSCGDGFTAGLKADGTLWTWGRNSYGQLGDNTNTHKSSPVQAITFGTNWSKVSCKGLFTGAIKTDGTLWIWGMGFYGQLGDNTSGWPRFVSSPVQTVAGGTNWTQISCGYGHVLATKSDNSLWSWGNNSLGTLGDGTTVNTSSPVQTLATGFGWAATDDSLSAGTNTSFALTGGPSLSLNTNPAFVYSGIRFGTQPIVWILDSNGNLDTGATDSITASVTSGNATLAGTVTVNAVAGVGTFTDLKLTGYGLITLQFAATGYANATVNLFVEVSGAVLPKRSENTSSIPTSGQLMVGELALNLADQIGFVKKTDGSIIQICNGKEADGGLF